MHHYMRLYLKNTNNIIYNINKQRATLHYIQISITMYY